MQKVITIRLSPELHAKLRKTTFQLETTMNRLCVAIIEKAVENHAAAQERKEAEERRA